MNEEREKIPVLSLMCCGNCARYKKVPSEERHGCRSIGFYSYTRRSPEQVCNEWTFDGLGSENRGMDKNEDGNDMRLEDLIDRAEYILEER